MILYKYFSSQRIDTLLKRRLRFTQPADFNDPFEFRPFIEQLVSEAQANADFDEKWSAELRKYGTILELIPPKELAAQTIQLRNHFFSGLNSARLAIIKKLDDAFNKDVGVLCLSSRRESILMWSHYSSSHTGFVVGFDSQNEFFNKKRTAIDEFGFLRQVTYQITRPKITLANCNSGDWVEKKHIDWAYEYEWRMMRALREASETITDAHSFPLCFFEFQPDAVVEIIVGMNASSGLRSELRALSASFPHAALLCAKPHPTDFAVLIEKLT